MTSHHKTELLSIASIVLDEAIYPRRGIDHDRVRMFAENIRDDFTFDPIEVEQFPGRPGVYRLLDGAHRWSAYKSTGVTETQAVIIDLDGDDSLLYAARKAIGPRQLTEGEAKDTARRAYTANNCLSSFEIGKAIGRSRQTVDSYISDLRAATYLDMNLRLYRMNRLGIPQNRIAKRLGLVRTSLFYHLSKMPVLANSANADLSRGFSVAQVAEKHGWTDPMVWSLALKNKGDHERFKALGWGLRTWDNWGWTECDKRFGDDRAGRIPAQLIAHILFYFSRPGDLVLDPMAGVGVTPDTCLVLNRRCWSFDMVDRPEKRPEIEPYTWALSSGKTLAWPVNSKEKADLIIFDPPCFNKNPDGQEPENIASLTRKAYLEFLEAFFVLLGRKIKKTSRLAFIHADWRDYQNTPAARETGKRCILIDDYLHILEKSGWHRTHIIQAPMSAKRFGAGIGSAMQKKRILGVTSRYVIILRSQDICSG